MGRVISVAAVRNDPQSLAPRLAARHADQMEDLVTLIAQRFGWQTADEVRRLARARFGAHTLPADLSAAIVKVRL